MPALIETASLARIWGFQDGHIPAVHCFDRFPWRDVIPTDAQAKMMACENPVPVWSADFPLPGEFNRLPDGAKSRIAAYVTLAVIERCKPRYHKSLVASRIIETSGTTIMVTCPDDAGESQTAVPLSFGESYFKVMRRWAERIRFGDPAHRPHHSALIRGYLPTPQAVVSVGDQEVGARANLLGSAGNTAFPTEVFLTEASLTVVSEHRLFARRDWKLFTLLWLFIFYVVWMNERTEI